MFFYFTQQICKSNVLINIKPAVRLNPFGNPKHVKGDDIRVEILTFNFFK